MPGFYLTYPISLLPKSRKDFKFHPDFTSFTKVIYLFKKELRIKAKVKDLHMKELGLDFYFKIFASSRYLLSLSAFAAGAQRGGNQKILISDFSGFPTSLDNGGYSQQSPKTLTTGKTINLFLLWREWCARICLLFEVLDQKLLALEEMLRPTGCSEAAVWWEVCEVCNNPKECRECLRSQCVDWKHWRESGEQSICSPATNPQPPTHLSNVIKTTNCPCCTEYTQLNLPHLYHSEGVVSD